MARMRWSIVPIIGCLSWSLASGAILFSDDFSDPGTTNLNWISPFTTLTRTCADGVYTIANSDADAAFVTTTLSPKPSILTASAKLTRSSESITAGILICFNTSTAAGYLLQLNPNQGIQLTKYSGGSTGSIIFNDRSPAVVSGANELKISKKNDSITLFCNGTFITALRDASPVAAGDAGFLVPGKQSAIFDDFVVTDEWIPQPQPIACFRDDFSVATTTWLDYGQKHQKEVAEGYLKITTTASGAYADPYVRVDQLGLDTFVAMTAVSHRSGDSSNMYGIFLCGAPVSNVVPIAYFCINANRQCDAYIGGDIIGPLGSTRIRGAAFQGTYYTDTIKVIKRRNTPYRMYVNGYLLDSLAVSRVPFAVIGAGINVENRMVIWSDFFLFGPGEICPVIAPARLARSFSAVRFTPYQSDYLFDPMGRIIRARSGVGQGIRTLVPGLYIMPGGKNGVVVK